MSSHSSERMDEQELSEKKEKESSLDEENTTKPEKTPEKKEDEEEKEKVSIPSDSSEPENKQEKSEPKKEGDDQNEKKVSSWNEPWEESPVGMSKKQIAFTLCGLTLGLFLASLDQTIVSTALPTIISDFQRLDLYSWPIIAYLLTSTTAVPLSGKLSDIFGRKILFMGSMVIFIIGSIICGAAPNMISLIIFRGLQGFGGGAIISLTLVIIGDIVSVRQRGKFGAVFGLCFAVASVLGPVLGGVITDNSSWRWIFYINVPIGIVGLFVVYFFLNLPGEKLKFTDKKLWARVDGVGALLLVAGIVGVLLASSFGGQQYAWDSIIVILLYIFGGIILILCLLWEQFKAKEPIIPLRIVIKRNVGIPTLISFVIGWGMFGSISFIPIYFQVVRGDSPTISGLKLIPLMLGIIVMSMTSGGVISKTGQFWFFPIFGGICFVTGLGLLGGLLTVDINYGILFIFMLLIGMGIGSVIQTLIVITQSSVERKDMASATALITFVRSMGGAIGVDVFNVILNNQLAINVEPQFLHLVNLGRAAIFAGAPTHANDILKGYNDSLKVIFWSAVPVIGIGLFLAFAIKRTKIAAVGDQKGPTQKTAEDAPVPEVIDVI